MPEAENIIQSDGLLFEVMKSEILRIKAFAMLFGFVFIITSIGILVIPDLSEILFQGKIKPTSILIFFGSVFLYYFAALNALKQLHKRGKMFPAVGRYANAVFEGLFPSIALFIFFPKQDPAGGLSNPPLLAYTFFIVLSILRLDFKISLVTGIVAAAGYLLMVNHFIILLNLQAQTTMLFAMPRILLKPALF